jgi:hypothetical protein
VDNDDLMPERRRPPDLEGLRFRAFLEQLSKELFPNRGISDKGAQSGVREQFGKRPNGKPVLPQSLHSQYLTKNPKVAKSQSVRGYMRGYERTMRQRVAWTFFSDPLLVAPKYTDYVVPVIGLAKAKPAAPVAVEPVVKERSPALRILDFAAEREASPDELRRFREAIERNGLADDPQERELETLFNEVVRKRTPEQQAQASRNRELRAEREKLGGVRVSKKPRPPKKRAKSKKPRATRTKRRPSESPDVTA